MKAVIVCESLFGNTEVLAQLVRKGMGRAGVGADLVEVGRAFADPPDLSSYDLMVVAAPTHALSMSRPESRADAVAHGADPRRQAVGVREWLATFTEAIPDPPPLVAVFDTRLVKARHWPGSAAHRASRRLRREGFHVIKCSSFYVDGITGPVSAGEAERAEAWGTAVAALARTRVRKVDGPNGNHR